MASDADHRRHRRLTVAALAGPLAAALSGALFFYGTGLHPVSALTWWAPLPVMALAPRLTGWQTGAAAYAAFFVGQLNQADYYLHHLRLPAPILALTCLCLPLVFVAVTLLFRRLVLRGHPLGAAVGAGAAWAGAEYLMSLVGPVGANWTLSTTQADVVPVIQISSVTGVWGVSFLLITTPALVAALAQPAVAARTLVAGTLTATTLAALTFGYGYLRLHPAQQPDRLLVALASAASTDIQVPVSSPAGHDLVSRYAGWVASLPPAGSQLVVLPEYTFLADTRSLRSALGPLHRAARQAHADVVVGVMLQDGRRQYDAAVVLPGGPAAPLVYTKHFRVPGQEDDNSTGHALGFVPGHHHQVGVAICADFGHPALSRSYARAGARLMLNPALDFDVDGWQQSRVQLLRGVESGFAMARSALAGRLTMTDAHGRLVAETSTGPQPAVTSITASVPLGPGATPYARAGDVFGRLCLALTAVALALAVRRRPPRAPRQPSQPGQPTASTDPATVRHTDTTRRPPWR